MPILFTCPHCGRQTNVPDEYAGQSGPCAGCGLMISVPRRPGGGGSPPRRMPGIGDDPALRLLLPVGRSGLSIAAGYMGLFAVLGVFAPIALLLGVLAIRDLKRHPEKHGMGRAIFGVVTGGLFTAFLLIVLLGASLGW